MDKETYSAAPFGLLCDLLSNPEQTFISNKLPKFGWIVPSGYQKSYQILVASSKVEESGFSQNICLPASAALITTSA